MSEDYEVGYGKPPKHTQFKKGQSGNPKGRPTGSKNFSTDVKATLQAPVRINSDGRPRTVSTQEAALMRLREKALKGDNRSLDRIIELARTYNDEEMAEAAAKLSLTDDEILEAYNERLLRRAGKSRSGDGVEARNDAARRCDAANDTDDAPEKEDDDAWLR
jgi:hypothetical protein